MSSVYSGANNVTLIQSDGIVLLVQFFYFSRYVPENIEEKEHVINSVSNVNSKGDEIHHLIKDCMILVLLYPL